MLPHGRVHTALDAEPELLWEELDEEAIRELEDGLGDAEYGSDSEGEMDYPDEESGNDSDDQY